MSDKNPWDSGPFTVKLLDGITETAIYDKDGELWPGEDLDYDLEGQMNWMVSEIGRLQVENAELRSHLEQTARAILTMLGVKLKEGL